ncbi:MAG: caspase family protein [Bacteroidota bacterium]
MQTLLTKSLFILSICLASCVIVQAQGESFYFVNIESKVTKYVNDKMSKWVKKDEFENSDEYKRRMSKQDVQAEAYTQEAIKHFVKDHIRKINFSRYKVSDYDADSESFQITIDKIGQIVLPVPRINGQAKRFKQQREFIDFDNPEFAIQNNSWVLTNIDVKLDTFVYKYDVTKNSTYNPRDNFSVTWDGAPIAIESGNISKGVSKGAIVINTDADYNVDANLPISRQSRPDDIAIVIGNMYYDNIDAWVDYAIEDAQSIKEYLINVLGYREGNVIMLKNATKGDLEKHFGTPNNHKGLLYDLVKPRKSRVFIYYAGHGAPGRENEEPYLVPKDGDLKSMEITGYSLKTFYNNIGKLDIDAATIVIDACFSGSEVLEGLSGIIVRERPSNNDNIVVLSSSQVDQYSCWYDAKRHGLFTYLFLKAIHDYQTTDGDDNKQLTYAEIFKYITEHDGGLSYYARRLQKNDQDPVLSGKLDPQTVFIDFN